MVKEFPRLGRVMCLTRNDHAVHERYGVFEAVSFFGPTQGMGQVVGRDIDLRLFMTHWHSGFAVEEPDKKGERRRSFQFFDKYGTALHKVYIQPESEPGVYEALLGAYRSPDQTTKERVEAAQPETAAEKPDEEVDVEGFQTEWLALSDTHQFFILLKKHGLSRVQALRLAPEGYAWEVEADAARPLLEEASGVGLPIMVFIGSPGCVQIHTGPVSKIAMFGDEWLNVLDPDFQMHLRQSAVTSAWIVRKPTQSGVVTSLELFDAEGGNVALFFGVRDEAGEEDPRWISLVQSLKSKEGQ